MMESMESCVPPGFRFHPTDEELVGYYLRKKVASQKIDLDVIREIDLYRIEPWDLQERCRIGYEEQNEWYFFSHKDKKYPTGTRTNRATMAGFWKATGRDKAVYDKTKLIGMRKTLVFYKGRAPNGQKTDWIMHEYRLESDENGPPQEEGWVVCRAFKKKTNGQMKSMEGWDSSYLLDQETTHFISSHPHHTHTHHHTYNSNLPQNNNYNNNNMCKQEIEVVDNLTCFINSSSSDQFIQHLPQLQSPSLPLIKTPSTSLVSLISNNINNNEEEEEEEYHRHDKTITNKVTDWRALDKFVASQLSQDHHTFETHPNCSNNNVNTTSSSNDMSLLLLHSTTNKVADHIQEEEGEEEGNKYLCLSPFLNTRSSSDCDIGICVFDK